MTAEDENEIKVTVCNITNDFTYNSFENETDSSEPSTIEPLENHDEYSVEKPYKEITNNLIKETVNQILDPLEDGSPLTTSDTTLTVNQNDVIDIESNEFEHEGYVENENENNMDEIGMRSVNKVDESYATEHSDPNESIIRTSEIPELLEVDNSFETDDCKIQLW